MMYNTTESLHGDAYVDVRVCDLQIQYGNMPSGLDSTFYVDGLYIVLRCGDAVHRTQCLWTSSSPSLMPPFPSGGPQGAGDNAEGDDESDWVWNELFRLPVPPPPPPPSSLPQQGSAASAPAQGKTAGVGGSPGAPFTPPLMARDALTAHDASSNPVLPMSTAAAAAGGGASPYPSPSVFAGQSPAGRENQRGGPSPAPHQSPEVAAARTSPFLYPAIEVELWRSTPVSENCLARYTYHVPLELMHGGYGLQQLDAVAERVVPLRTKEAPSIMGNLYGWSGHRLSLRLRVQAVGLPPVTADWTLPDEGMAAGALSGNSVLSGGAGAYSLPYSVALIDPANRAVLMREGYGEAYNAFNPVLANLLAPLGAGANTTGGVLSVAGATQSPARSVSGVLDMQPVFPQYQPSSVLYAGQRAHAGGGGVLATPAAAAGSSGAFGGQGILGDGSAPWQGPVLP